LKLQLQGRAWVFGDQINTDLMYPHVCYTTPEAERPAYTMWANRPEWAKQVTRGDILIAGRNFGTGSSRPAAANLKGLGLACAVADSVNGLFLRNAVNFGFPVASVPDVSKAVREGEIVTVDLENGYFTNDSSGYTARFDPLPKMLLEIINSGGIIDVLRSRGLLESKPL
jgi:3-isopropylmalate/(R)-2-methylmalate dehydratase small subunit